MQVKALANAIQHISGKPNSTELFLATVSRYDDSTRSLYVLLDGGTSEIKAIPIGDTYDMGKRVMCCRNSFGSLFAVGQDEKGAEMLLKRAWFDVSEIEAGDSLMCHTEIVQKDAILAYEWISTNNPDRVRSGIAYSTTNADIGDTLYCRVYDKSGKYGGFLTTGMCTVIPKYDPGVEYDIGQALKSGQGDTDTYGAGVELKKIEGSASKIELQYQDTLSGSAGGRAPIFVSEYICIISNNQGDIFVGYRSSTGSSAEDLGVSGLWKWQRIGSWNRLYTIVADGSNLYVNDALVLSDMEDYGWGDFIPHWFGKNLNTDSWTSGNVFAHKIWSDGNLVLDLVPVKIKGASEQVAGNTGLFDYVENVYYPGNGELGFIA